MKKLFLIIALVTLGFTAANSQWYAGMIELDNIESGYVLNVNANGYLQSAPQYENWTVKSGNITIIPVLPCIAVLRGSGSFEFTYSGGYQYEGSNVGTSLEMTVTGNFKNPFDIGVLTKQ